MVAAKKHIPIVKKRTFFSRDPNQTPHDSTSRNNRHRQSAQRAQLFSAISRIKAHRIFRSIESDDGSIRKIGQNVDDSCD